MKVFIVSVASLHGVDRVLGCALDNFGAKKVFGPLKISFEMAHKVICPRKKKSISHIFNISGTLTVKRNAPVHKILSGSECN
jgi:hypothetical protein